MRISLLLLALVPLLLAAQTNQVDGLDSALAALRDTCDKLAEDPRDKDAVEELLAYAHNTNGIDRLRSRAMAAYALTGLLNGSTNLYVQARQSHAGSYPDDRHLLKIDPKECYIACPHCRGEGFVMGPCPACKGETRCPECKGKGIVFPQKSVKGVRSSTRGQKCEACDGSGRLVCRRCGGKNLVALRCPDCKGTPYEFKTPQKAIDEFSLLVKGISKWISNEEVFFKQFGEVGKEPDPAKRIKALRSLIAAYGYRPEKAEMERMLAAEEAALKERAVVSKQDGIKVKRDLIMLRDLKESGNPEAAITMIRDYLEENPDTENRIELQGIISEMEARVAKKAGKRKYFYILGLSIAILFGLSLFRFRKFA